MKNNDIINLAAINSTDKITFKDPKLTDATRRITAIYNDAVKYADVKNREIASILDEVNTSKSFEADGFKNVAEYASKTFGLARQNAYALARAGRVYNDPKAHKELKAMTPSKIAEVEAVDDKVLNKALTEGTISSKTTQKDLREFAAANSKKSNEKPKVLDTYTARPCVGVVDDKAADTFKKERTIEEWDDFFMDFVKGIAPGSPIEIVSLKKLETHDSNVKRIAQRRLYMNRTYAVVVEFYKHVPGKKAAKDPVKQKFTKEELMKMIAELDEEA